MFRQGNVLGVCVGMGLCRYVCMHACIGACMYDRTYHSCVRMVDLGSTYVDYTTK